MAVLIRPRSWGAVKPPPGSSINWGLPLAQGLYLCFPMNEQGGAPRDLVRGLQTVATPGAGSVGWAPMGGRRTVGMGARNTGVGYWSLGAEGSAPLTSMPTTACTVMLARHTVAQAGNDCAFGIGTDSAHECLAYISFAGTVYWDYGGGAGANRVSVGGLSLADDTWAFVAGLRGSMIVQNGVVRASQGTAISRMVGTETFGIGNGGGSSTNNAGNENRYGFFYMWSRELSLTEIQWLHAEPFALLNPPAPKILYFDFLKPATAAGTPGLANVTRKLGLTAPQQLVGHG